MQVQSLGGEDPLEEGMATHSSTLENPMDGGALHVHTHTHTRTHTGAFVELLWRAKAWATHLG